MSVTHNDNHKSGNHVLLSPLSLSQSKSPTMASRMIKFPSIEQSRHVLPAIIHDAQFTHIDPTTNTPCYNTTAPLPVLEFRGAVKLHGSNAAIVQTGLSTSEEMTVHFQSRERVLDVQNDLMGFCAYMSGKTKAVAELFEVVRTRHREASDSGGAERDVRAIAVFGEWCGAGIQKGVALSKIPKMFVIFAIEIIYAGDEAQAEWLDMVELADVRDEKARIFNIMMFQTFSVVIDFGKKESLVQAKKKMDEWTLGVEEECPVGKYFGVEGVGEGIVWQAIRSPGLPEFKDGRYRDSRFWFKTKGLKHASYNKPEAASKASASPETMAKVDLLVELVVTPGRLQQGLQVLEREMLLPLEMKSIGAFIKWINGDVMKEEYDRIEEAGLDKKALSGPISSAAKKWYIAQLEDVSNWGTGGGL
jgi:hypothetical protein